MSVFNAVGHGSTTKVWSRAATAERRRARRRLVTGALTLVAACVIVLVSVAASVLAADARWSGTSAGVWFAALVTVYLVGRLVTPKSR